MIEQERIMTKLDDRKLNWYGHSKNGSRENDKESG